MSLAAMVPISTYTCDTTQTSIVFGSGGTLPQNYTDLVLVVQARDSRTELNDSYGLMFNSDTSTGSTNYSHTTMVNYNSVSNSGRDSSYRNVICYGVTGTLSAAGYFGNSIVNIQDYANNSSYKTVINYGGVTEELYYNLASWRDFSPIKTITIVPGYNGSGYNFAVGSTFTLYGIL
jgi:hypothetical protein